MAQITGTFRMLSLILDPYTSSTLLQDTLGKLSPNDWSDLEELAAQHKITSRFYQTTGGSVKPEGFPSELHAQLKKTYLQNAVRNTLILHHAAHLLGSLRENNIELSQHMAF